jgi:SAM-dependent methyltransferase
MNFKDHFSRQAATYSRHRPGYPAALIDWVAGRAPDRRAALDCATGSGQAARALAARFERVIAVDGSLSQLVQAPADEAVAYVAGLAERLPVRDGSVSLVAAAQAAHWFDFDRFHAECRRVLVPGGVVALWTYGMVRVNADVDAVIDQFYEGAMGPFWPPERRYVEEGYRTLPFPWPEVPAPEFELSTDWDLGQVQGYLASWSAVQRYRDQRGQDPLEVLRPVLEAAWGRPGPRRLRWPLYVRLGRA